MAPWGCRPAPVLQLSGQLISPGRLFITKSDGQKSPTPCKCLFEVTKVF